ncbi:MAG: hypothetical protein ACXADB_11350, partial [Candidatus Hermodarchaeia archaeon]
MSKKQTLSEELAGEGDAKFLEKLKVYMPSITEYFKTSKERVKTGVEGLDQLMEGGLINRSVVLVSG